MKIEMNAQQLKKIGMVAGQVGKAIVIEGVKGLALKAAGNVITTALDDGFDAVKKLSLDEVIGVEKKDKPKKKKLFSKKKKDEEILDDVATTEAGEKIKTEFVDKK
jgi:hypothetical protein